MTGTIDRSAVEAMYNRAKQLVLTMGWLGNANNLRFAQGALCELDTLLQSKGPDLVAARDASMGGYQPPTGFEAAWAALPVGAKNFTLAEVQEFLRSHGIEAATDTVTNSDVNTVGDFKNRVVPAIDGNDEHPSARTELDNGSGLHARLLVEAAIVAQGGAA